VRGVVMNPVDHPHGGGEGKSTAGRHPVTPLGETWHLEPEHAKRKRHQISLLLSGAQLKEGCNLGRSLKKGLTVKKNYYVN